MRDPFALEIGDLLEWAVLLDDQPELVALKVVGEALDRKRHRAREIHRECGRPGGKAADVQPARAHGLDFRGVRLNLIEHDLLAGALGEMIGERLEYFFVYSRVFHRRVGEYYCARVSKFARVLRRIRDEVPVFVAILRVEVAAVLAGVLGKRDG